MTVIIANRKTRYQRDRRVAVPKRLNAPIGTCRRPASAAGTRVARRHYCLEAEDGALTTLCTGADADLAFRGRVAAVTCPDCKRALREATT